MSKLIPFFYALKPLLKPFLGTSIVFIVISIYSYINAIKRNQTQLQTQSKTPLAFTLKNTTLHRIKNTMNKKTYSTKEASKILDVKERTIQFRCKRDDVRKKDNKYLITDDVIQMWKTKSANPTQRTTQYATQDVTRLELEIIELKNKLISIAKVENIQMFKLDAIESVDYTFDGIKGNLVFVDKNKIFVEYTKEEYANSEALIREWGTLQTQIETNEEIFNVKLKSSKEIQEHYRIQFEYQKEQSGKILSMHQKLIDTIEAQNKLAMQRNFIEAKSKKLDEEK